MEAVVIGIVLSKILGIAGIGGLIAGSITKTRRGAVFLGVIIGAADHFIIVAINPSIGGDSEALRISILSALIIAPVVAFLSFNFKRLRKKNAE